MRFYKSTVPGHPTSKLPTVQWSEELGKPLYEFLRFDPALSLLSMETEDPELIRLLAEAGYMTEETVQPGHQGNIKGVVATHGAVDPNDLPPPITLTPEQVARLQRRR
jgi:hypothetical protein